MESLDRRPLGAFASAFFAALCILYQLDVSALTWLLPIFFAAFAASFLFYEKMPYRRALTAVTAAMFVASLFSVYALDVKLTGAESLAGKEEKITGTVLDVRYSSSWEGCYTVSTDGMDIILYSDDGELKGGDVIRCNVMYDKHDESGDLRDYLLADGIILSAETVGEVSVIGRDNGIRVSMARLQTTLSARLRAFMSSEAGGFSAALILGDRACLSDEITRDFRTLGISHILALSGTHVAIIFSVIGSLSLKKDG